MSWRLKGFRVKRTPPMTDWQDISTAPMRDETPCPVCHGRGYLRCSCWPGDCICGEGDVSCENCFGDGYIYPDDDDWYPAPPTPKGGA